MVDDPFPAAPTEEVSARVSRPPRPSRAARVGKEISVMAWVEDPYGNVLFVRQSSGKRFWSLPGGKVDQHESLENGLRRETFEEIGLEIASLHLLTIFDRPEKSSLAFLYRATLKPGKMKFPKGEIETATFLPNLPMECTPSARYFWQRMHVHKTNYPQQMLT